MDTYEQAVHAVNESFLKIFRGFPAFASGDRDELEPSLTNMIKRNIVETVIGLLSPGVLLSGAAPRLEQLEGLFANDKQEDDGYRLIQALRRLPPLYRTVFNLHVIEKYSHAEIAALVGVSTRVSESSVGYARAMLREMDTVVDMKIK